MIGDFYYTALDTYLLFLVRGLNFKQMALNFTKYVRWADAKRGGLAVKLPRKIVVPRRGRQRSLEVSHSGRETHRGRWR